MSQSAPSTASPLFSEEGRRDPIAVVSRLREEDPVHYVPGLDFWLVTRHEDVKRLFADPAVTPDRRAWARYEPPPAGSFAEWAAAHGLFALPPEDHARIRRLVSAAFTPRAIARQEVCVQEVVERFAAPLRGRSGVVDLMAEFTDPIPNAVISRITGIPPAGDDEVRFRELAQLTIRGFFAFHDRALQERGGAAFLELVEWVRKMAAERRAAPRDDLISDLVQVQARDERLGTDEIAILVTGLVGAGSETTAMGAMAGIRTLLARPDVLARLRADRSLLPGAVSEILRMGFGAAGVPRYALRDFELRGRPIRKGQMLMLSFGAAGRDPRVYEDPERFDPARDTRELLTFGNGPHFCLGAHLARAELRCMIGAALDFLPPAARLRDDLIQWSEAGLFRRPATFPVELDPPPDPASRTAPARP